MDMRSPSVQKKAPHRKSERGNIFFFIFIGCALFAALSYTVANMMKSGNPARVAEEKSRLYAGEILDLGRKLKTTVQDLRISNSCRPEELSFDVTGLTGYAFTTRDACKIYNPAGGAMSYFAPSADWLDGAKAGVSPIYGQIYVPSNVCVQDVGEGGSDCDGNSKNDEDLVVFVPFIKPEVCKQINKSLGLPETPPVEAASAWSAVPARFQGSFADGVILNQSGLTAGCFAGSGTNDPPANSYHFVQVLLAR
jgi:hypothetical protein